MNDKQYIEAKVKKSLRNLLGKDNYLSGHSLSRFNLLSRMVSAILISGQTRINQIALNMDDRKTKLASRKTQVKRWVKNKHVSYDAHYLPYVKELLRCLAQSGLLVFSIDGSVVGKGCMCLMFSVIYKGRAIPVVWKVYKAKKGHLPESAHRNLLESLSELVPDDCRIVITGDGEFDGCDWQADILELGWNYVLRTSKNAKITDSSAEEFIPQSVCLSPGEDLFFEDIYFTKKKWLTHLLVWHGKGHKKPLYLVTNLDFTPEIKQFYKKRFKIEPFFRDLKSKGFHIQRSGLRDPKRLSRLLIAACLAYVLCIMASTKACKSKFYSLIVEDDGDSVSIFQVGLRFIRKLKDLRQWRSFSWARDIIPDPPPNFKCLFCVPF